MGGMSFLGALLLLAGSDPNGGEGLGRFEPMLSVDLCDCTGQEPLVLEAMRWEIEAIYESARVGIRWEEPCGSMTTAPHDTRSAKVYILSEIPNAVRRRFQFVRKTSNIMALGLRSPNGIAVPMIYLSLEKVEENASKSGLIELTESQLSRALGRVAAHELAHRFLQSKHTSRGILKNPFGPQDLIDDVALRPYFTPEQANALQLVARAR